MSRPTSADVRRAVVESYERGARPDVHGEPVELYPHSLSPEHYESLVAIANIQQPARTLEVGLCLGFSALALLESGADRDEPSKHVAIDPFQASYWRNTGVRWIAELGLDDRFELLEERSQLAMPRMVDEGQIFDLVFVDGDHRFDSAFIDVYFALQLVEPGSLVIVDDFAQPAVRLTVSYFAENTACRVVVPEHSGRWVAADDHHLWRSPPRLAALEVPPGGMRFPFDEFTEFGAGIASPAFAATTLSRSLRRRVRKWAHVATRR